MSAAISNQWQATKGLLTEQAKDVRKELEHEDPDSYTCKHLGGKNRVELTTRGGYEAVE